MEEGPGEPSTAPPPPAALLRVIDDFLQLKRCLSAVLPATSWSRLDCCCGCG